jgi:hypothetical protein
LVEEVLVGEFVPERLEWVEASFKNGVDDEKKDVEDVKKSKLFVERLGKQSALAS